MSRRAVLPPAPITWQSLIEEFLTWLRAVGRSPKTVELRGYQLRHIAREVGGHPNAVTEDDLLTFFALFPDWGPETRKTYRSAMCSFFEWAWKFGRVTTNPAADLPRVRTNKPTPRPADDAAWLEALAAADLRLTLILRLAAEAGLRRAEIAQVHTRDLIDTPAGAHLIVHGKGGKKRVVPLSEGLAELVRLGAAGHSPGASPTGFLFPSIRGTHVSAAWVGTMASAVLPEGMGIHTLRHRFATRAYRGTRNIRAVQTLLGHSNVNTTQVYTQVDDDEVRAAAMAAAL